jgi:hypothetical protein
MRMLCSGINMKTSEKFTPKSVLRKHTTNGMLNQTLGMLRTDQGRGMLALTAWIA